MCRVSGCTCPQLPPCAHPNSCTATRDARTNSILAHLLCTTSAFILASALPANSNKRYLIPLNNIYIYDIYSVVHTSRGHILPISPPPGNSTAASVENGLADIRNKFANVRMKAAAATEGRGGGGRPGLASAAAVSGASPDQIGVGAGGSLASDLDAGREVGAVEKKEGKNLAVEPSAAVSVGSDGRGVPAVGGQSAVKPVGEVGVGGKPAGGAARDGKGGGEGAGEKGKDGGGRGEEEFVCDGGKKRLPKSRVNDDFCDCEDASDEKRTSACENNIFECRLQRKN